jgi:hypothetical protein
MCILFSVLLLRLIYDAVQVLLNLNLLIHSCYLHTTWYYVMQYRLYLYHMDYGSVSYNSLSK